MKKSTKKPAKPAKKPAKKSAEKPAFRSGTYDELQEIGGAFELLRAISAHRGYPPPFGLEDFREADWSNLAILASVGFVHATFITDDGGYWYPTEAGEAALGEWEKDQ